MIIRCLPWYTTGSITFINNIMKWYPHILNRNLKVLEIGAGNSSLYFLSKGCSIVSVESDDFCVDSIIGSACSFGFNAKKSEWKDFKFKIPISFSSPELQIFKAQTIKDMPQNIFDYDWDIIVNDGISRHECLEGILQNNKNSIIILDNVEYCANWGTLQRSTAYPLRIKVYREFLRSSEYNHYFFEQEEGRSGHSSPDSFGWEAPHRWITSIGWRRNHIMNILMVTNIGFPLVNMQGIADEDIKTVRDRCPYSPDSIEFEKTLELKRSFE